MATWEQSKADARRAARAHDEAWGNELASKIVEACHPEQRDFVLDPHRRVVACVGRGGGKTTGMRARMVRRMVLTAHAKVVFIATTRIQAEDLVWNGLKDTCERLGIEATFNETKLRCTFKRNGSQVRLVGADDKREIDKLRGQPFHEVIIDEAASYPASLLEALIVRIIGPRLGDYGGCIVMGGTPGHILQGQFYDSTRPGSDRHRPYSEREKPEWQSWKGWSSHAWTLQSAGKRVPAMARLWAEALIEKEANGWSDDHPVWLREFLGLWAADDTENVFKYRPHLPDGTPHNQWDPERVGQMRIAKLPPRDDWHYGIGLDLGHSDPFACCVFAFSPSDASRTLYHVYEFERPKMYARTIAELLIGEELDAEEPEGLIGQIGWPEAGIVADLAGLGDSLIDELQQVYGIRIVAAEKGARYKHPAIELFNGDLIDGRIKVLKGSSLETQLMSLQWVTDEFGGLKENKAQANHSSDAAIYVRRAIATLFSGPEAKAPTPKPVVPELDEQAEQHVEDDFKELISSDLFSDNWDGF